MCKWRSEVQRGKFSYLSLEHLQMQPEVAGANQNDFWSGPEVPAGLASVDTEICNIKTADNKDPPHCFLTKKWFTKQLT